MMKTRSVFVGRHVSTLHQIMPAALMHWSLSPIDSCVWIIVLSSTFNCLYIFPMQHFPLKMLHLVFERAMLWDMPVGNESIAWEGASQHHSLQINLSVLIQKIYLSPTIEDWLIPQLKELLTKYGFPNIPLIKSDLYAPHVY